MYLGIVISYQYNKAMFLLVHGNTHGRFSGNNLKKLMMKNRLNQLDIKKRKEKLKNDK